MYIHDLLALVVCIQYSTTCRSPFDQPSFSQGFAAPILLTNGWLKWPCTADSDLTAAQTCRAAGLRPASRQPSSMPGPAWPIHSLVERSDRRPQARVHSRTQGYFSKKKNQDTGPMFSRCTHSVPLCVDAEHQSRSQKTVGADKGRHLLTKLPAKAHLEMCSL